MRKPLNNFWGAIHGLFLSFYRNDRAFLRHSLPRTSSLVACILILATCIAAETMNAQTAVARILPKPSNARYAMHRLATQANSQLDGAYAYIVQPQVLTWLIDLVEYDESTCAFISSGSWAVPTPPANGTYSTQFVTAPLPTGDKCGGNTYQFNQIDYTWTSTSPLANTDYMVVNWTTPDGTLNLSYGIYIYICPPPTVVTSFDPDIWYAGRNQYVTITGTGFVPAVQANAECPMTTVSATSADNSAVTVSNVDVLSETSIIAYVEPVSTAPTEGATLIVSGAPTPSPNADILGTPVISLNGTVISGPNAAVPPPVPVVGQQLLLTTTPTATTLAALPIPLGINSSTWTVTGGTNIGGYTPTTASATVTPMPPKTTPDLTFYSVYPAASIAETYQLCTGPPAPPTGGGHSGNACNPIATSNFSLTGPTVSSMSNPTGYVGIFGGPVLGYGPVGIQFNPTLSNTTGDSGQFEWIQLITNDTLPRTSTAGITQTCVNVTVPPTSGGTGLDTGYPYATGNSTQDSPTVPLNSTTYEQEARSFSAQMYLLWDAVLPVGCTPGKSCTSIPVPLGSVTWGWSGTATYSSNSWSLTSSSTTTPSWTASSSYPTWTDYLPYKGNLLCH